MAKRNIVAALNCVAEHLGNTRAVCRKSYVHPGSLESYLVAGSFKIEQRRDQVHVTGQLALDGMLKVSLLAFNPLSGQSFDILDWGSLRGTFAALQLPSLASGLSLNTTQLYTARGASLDL